MNTFAMTRKPRNTIPILMLGGAVLAMGLIAAYSGSRSSPSSAPQPRVVEAAALHRIEALEKTSVAPPAAAKKQHDKAGKSNRIRQSMAMPYFSFASRG